MQFNISFELSDAQAKWILHETGGDHPIKAVEEFASAAIKGIIAKIPEQDIESDAEVAPAQSVKSKGKKR